MNRLEKIYAALEILDSVISEPSPNEVDINTLNKGDKVYLGIGRIEPYEVNSITKDDNGIVVDMDLRALKVNSMFGGVMLAALKQSKRKLFFTEEDCKVGDIIFQQNYGIGVSISNIKHSLTKNI